MAYFANYERGHGILRLNSQETEEVKEVLGTEPFTGNIGFTLKGDLSPFFCEIKRAKNGYLFYEHSGRGQLRVNPHHIKGLGINNSHKEVKVKNLEVIIDKGHVFVVEQSVKDDHDRMEKEEEIEEIEEEVKETVANLPVPQRFLNIDMGTLKNMINGILDFQNVELLDVTIENGRIASLRIKREETY